MRRITRREWVLGSVASGFASCVRSRTRGRKDSSTITVLYRGEPETVLGPDDWPAKFLVFMPLAAWNRRDSRGELEGRLAEHWEHSPDFRTWTIRLRDGIRWHDGVPVTAHDMKFTLDLMQHPDVLWRPPGGYTVEVIDNRTYAITYHRRDLGDDGAVNDWTVCWPRHLLERLNPKEIDTWDFWTRPLGCGPYRHVRTIAKTMMEFEANPDYFRGKPQIARVILKFGESPKIPELLSGNVDAAAYQPHADLFNISRNSRFRAYQQPTVSGLALWWNLRHPLFRDVAVRRALTYAINRRELLQLLNLPDEVHPIDFLRSSREARRGEFPESNPYNPELAQRLLDQAGWVALPGNRLRERGGQPFRFKTLIFGEETPAVYVQQQLKRIGVHMDIVKVSGDGPSRIRSGEFETLMWGLGVWAPQEELLRVIGYDNPSFFQLLEQSRITFDPEEQERLHDELTRIFRADVPLTFLYPGTFATIASTRVRGLDNSPYRGDLTQCMDELSLTEEHA